jgi:glyoxylase-like metal-dependent hydrolase (beta-lactamase superfamily II)
MAETDILVDNPGTRTPENGWFRFRIGEIEATIVSDGRMLPHDVAAFFPGLQPDDLTAAKAQAGVDGTHFSMEQNCLVLRYPGHVVLFDTGVGTDPVYGWAHSGLLLRSMAAAGIDPAEVTEVVLTHAHSDHAWGLTDAAGVRNFPNAQVLVPRVDFDHWTDLAKVALGGFTADFILGARRNLLAYQDRLTLFDGEAEILTGIRAVASPGHSPGHCSYIIGSGQDRCLFLGDVVHTGHLQMANPGWAFAYDHDPAQAISTRQALLTRAAAEGLNVIGYHFDFPGLGTVQREGAGFRFQAATP